MYCPQKLRSRIIRPPASRPGPRRPEGAVTLAEERDGRLDSFDSPMARDPIHTAELLARIRQGDLAARDILIARYLPSRGGWARGRLPAYARDLNQTDDLVQDTLIAAVKRLDDFEIRREGAFLAYLRRAILNRIRDEIRRVRRGPVRGELDSR